MSGAVEQVKQPEKQKPSIFWLVYGQIAAMLGAFSLLVFVTHFADVGLKGVIRDAFDAWVEYVRPLVGKPLHAIISWLPEGWRFHVSDVVKDYVGVGIVSAFALARAVTFVVRLDFLRWVVLPFAMLLSVVGWPIAVPLFLIGFRQSAAGGRTWQVAALWLAPLVYLGLIFAANYFLPA